MSNQLLNAYVNESHSHLNKIEISLEKRLEQLHPKKIDLSLNRISNLLSKLNNPQKKNKEYNTYRWNKRKGICFGFFKSFFKIW